MIKIAALNEESDEASGSEEEEVTREALEQIALAQYSKALELQRRGAEGTGHALSLLKDLLDTELLYDVKRPENKDKATGTLLNLKYLCYKNIASIQASLGDKEEAIESYCEAAALDDTDVSLWHCLGILCLQCDKFDMALDAFQRGCECNKKHWPCIDKIITLLLGLGHFNDCIVAIYDALKLDPDYLRGQAYRKHIYTEYPYILDYMQYISSEYAWKSEEDDFDKDQAEFLLKEAKAISLKHASQIKENTFPYTLPELKLQKPITSLSWINVGECLVHMHRYMTENCYSHASKLELVYENSDDSKIDISNDPPAIVESEEILEGDISESKTDDNSENYNVVDKPSEEAAEFKNSEAEQAESDSLVTDDNVLTAADSKPDTKEYKKAPVRRRGSALSFLEQWEWCTKRRSSRKKPQTKQEKLDETIYDILRRLVPISLTSDLEKKEKRKSERLGDSPNTMDLYHLFEEKQNGVEEKDEESTAYFGSPQEQDEVNTFLKKYSNGKSDIIDILRDYLMALAVKWQIKWPKGLSSVYVDANECCKTHCDIPCYNEYNDKDIKYFVIVNLLAEEMILNEKFNNETGRNNLNDISIIEAICMLVHKPHIFGNECMENLLRHIWLKFHYHLNNKNYEFAINCLYQLLSEFRGMGEHEETFSLKIVNFTFKPVISKAEIVSMIKFLERNKQLSTVMGLYELENFEEALDVVIDSFEHCKSIARKQEYQEMSLDFAVQLSLILDCYWGLGKVDECFKWSATCLKESLKHYLSCNPGSSYYEKWSMVVVKVLLCMHHCLKTEGTIFLDLLSEEELSQAVQDIIQVIGHQVEDNNGNEMPLKTVAPWIILHYILQREEDYGRDQKPLECDKSNDDIPNALMVLFVAHEYLGGRGECMLSDGELLYFTLDTVIHKLRAPSLSDCLASLCQHLEQCVFCLFGHPNKKTKLKYLVDHNVTPHKLDWTRAQQVYEVFRPVNLPEVEAKLPSITADTEQWFQRILALNPESLEPQKHISDVMQCIEQKNLHSLPRVPNLLPYKMRDLYHILGDYYFKKDERTKSMKYNIYDLMINPDRLNSWAEIALAKSTNLEVKLNSLNSEIKDMDYINEANIAITCFNRTLQLDPTLYNLWIEYGAFVYGLHSFCSRLLKQASESLSMEDFESLEQKKEELLDTAQKCFTKVRQDLNSSQVQPDEDDELWLHCYMLGKIAEKKGRPPVEYLKFYMEAAKHLEDNKAQYPTKINYNSPQTLSIESLEVHYRIHASILKYMEQHENKIVSKSDGKVFQEYIEKCLNGPFSKKKARKDNTEEQESVANSSLASKEEVEKKQDVSENVQQLSNQLPLQASTALKRSISDSGEVPESEAKKQKTEAAAKIRRAASYDADCQALKESLDPRDSALDVLFKAAMIHSQDTKISEADENDIESNVNGNEKYYEKIGLDETLNDKSPKRLEELKNEPIQTDMQIKCSQNIDKTAPVQPKPRKDDTSNSDTSNNSSSDSSSGDSSSSNSGSSSGTDTTTKSVVKNTPMSEEETMKIISLCLEALEDCVSRFSQHYKALYRLAHYHFYYKKGKDIERCRDLMLTSFTARNGQRLSGLFCDRRANNFFNSIWRIPVHDIDRAGSFPCHMSRCVLLTMEILKEIDDHKTLLDLSMQLSKIPDPDKKYLRDSEREELTQQAFSLCVQSLKGQLTKFSQQADLKTNEMERQSLNSLMLDIYRAYQKAQKQPNCKQFTNLLVEGYKLVSLTPGHENANLVDLSMKHCQSLIANLKQQAIARHNTMASINSVNAKKNISKSFECAKIHTAPINPNLPRPDPRAPTMPLIDFTSPANFHSMVSDTALMAQQEAALSFFAAHISSLSCPTGYPPSMQGSSLQQTIQNTVQASITSALENSFQNEYFKQYLASLAGAYTGLPKTQSNRGKKYNKPANVQVPKSFTSFPASTCVSTTVMQNSSPTTQSSTAMPIKPLASTVPRPPLSTSVSKSISAPTPSSYSMSQLLSPNISTSNFSSTPAAHMSTSTTTVSSGMVKPAHVVTSTTITSAIHTKPPLPHQQTSPGKTLQEKLSERQKCLSAMNKSNLSSQDIHKSISKLPSGLTVTKTTGHASAKEVPKISEVIVLDDDS